MAALNPIPMLNSNPDIDMLHTVKNYAPGLFLTKYILLVSLSTLCGHSSCVLKKCTGW